MSTPISEDNGLSYSCKNMKQPEQRNNPLISFQEAKSILQTSTLIKKSVISQTNELIEILRQRQQQLCNDIDEKSLQQINILEKVIPDLPSLQETVKTLQPSLLNETLDFESDFHLMKMVLKEYGRVIRVDKAEKPATELLTIRLGESLNLSTNHSPNDNQSQKEKHSIISQEKESDGSEASFEVIQLPLKIGLQDIDNEPSSDHDDDQETLSAIEAKYQEKGVITLSTLGNIIETTTIKNDTSSAKDQSCANTFPKGLFNQAMNDIETNNAIWIAESIDANVAKLNDFLPSSDVKKCELNSPCLFNKVNSSETSDYKQFKNISAWLLDGPKENVEEKEIKPVQEPSKQMFTWLSKSSKQNFNTKEIKPIEIPNQGQSSIAFWLEESSKKDCEAKGLNVFQTFTKEKPKKELSMIQKCMGKKKKMFALRSLNEERAKEWTTLLQQSYLLEKKSTKSKYTDEQNSHTIVKNEGRNHGVWQSLPKEDTKKWLSSNSSLDQFCFVEAGSSTDAVKPVAQNVFDGWLNSKSSPNEWLNSTNERPVSQETLGDKLFYL